MAQAPKVDLLNKEHKLLGEPENPEVDVAADAYKLQRGLLTGLLHEVCCALGLCILCSRPCCTQPDFPAQASQACGDAVEI